MATDIMELHGLLGAQAPLYTPHGLVVGESGYVTTAEDSIVAVRLASIRDTILNAGAEHGDSPQLHIVMPNDAFDNRSYKTELVRQSGQVGVEVHVHTPGTDDEAAELVEELSNPTRTDVHGIIPLLPSLTRNGEHEIRSRVHPDRDPDGVSGERVPATPVGMLIAAACLTMPNGPRFGRHHTLEDLTLQAYTRIAERAIGIGGMGALTNKPLVERLLKSTTINAQDIRVTLSTREDIENADMVAELRHCDVAFLAARRAAYVARRHLRRGAVAIDVGNTPCPELDGKSTGNLDASVFTLGGLERVIPLLRRRPTAFDRCVGRLSASTVIDRTTQRWLIDRRLRSNWALAS